MSGIQMALFGISTSTILTTGRATTTIKSTTVYFAGYQGANSTGAGFYGTFGSMTNATFKGLEVESLYWANTGGSYAGTGQTYLEVSGNRTTGYVTSVTSNGTSLGAIGTYSYNSAPNTTTITLGASNVSNPFGTDGDTRTIVIT